MSQQQQENNNIPVDFTENASQVPPIVIVVHGVGQQARYDTLRGFLDGWCRAFKIEFSLSRAGLASELLMPDTGGSQKKLVLEKKEYLDFGLIEYNYSSSIESHKDLLEYTPKRWVQSWRTRLKDIDSKRQGGKAAEFSIINSIVDDVSFAIFLSKAMADRARIQTNAIEHGATHFLQQVQLYIDYPPYRDNIKSGLLSILDNLDQQPEYNNRRLIFVAHSLGTVVGYSTILDAVNLDKPWAKRVSHLFTFGSPLDTLRLLFPPLVELPEKGLEAPIKWINYCLSNDPIATDLAIVRSSLENAPKIFDTDSPEEVFLGAGGALTAHTDYWMEDKMMVDIKRVAFDYHKENNEDSSISRHKLFFSISLSGSLFLASVFLSLASAWFTVVWWEENLKGSDSDRATLLEPPLSQICACLLLFGCIVSHVVSWSLSFWLRLVAFMSSIVFCGLSISKLPQLANFLMKIPVDTSKEPIAPVLLSSQSIPVNTNLLLLLIPISAFFGLLQLDRSDLGKAFKLCWVLALSFISICLTIFVGRRDNPSNATAEIALLVLIFVTWWLAILLARISYFLSSFVMGRKHLDNLSKRWGTSSKSRLPRAPKIDSDLSVRNTKNDFTSN